MGSWWAEHPDLQGLARRGRSELQEEAVAAEHDAELLRKRRRSLTDVGYEWMSRGDLVTIAAGGHQFEGHLIAAVNDLLVLATKTLEIAFNTANLQFARSDRSADRSGTAGERTVSSFRAALGRSEVEGGMIRLVGVAKSFDVNGIIEASTDDHVLLRDAQGVKWVLPRGQVAFAVGGEPKEP